MRTFLVFLVASLCLTAHALPVLDEICSSKNCVLPDCRCFGSAGPMAASAIPRMVTLTFDDDVNQQNHDEYMQLFDGLKNPNGCPVSATFFVSHKYTDYNLVQDLRHMRHEIADHSITHATPESDWETFNVSRDNAELAGQRTILSHFGNVDVESIIGYRQPFLEMSEQQFASLHASNFSYDNSWTTSKYSNPPIFPYTLDFPSPQECNIGQCPKKAYKGLWELPMINLMHRDGSVACSMLDACVGFNQTALLDLLNYNYHLHDDNHAPFGLYMHSAWFLTDPTHMPTLRSFLTTLLQSDPSVYIVSQSQVLAWMQSPTPLSAISSFPPWQCAGAAPPAVCAQPNSCHYTVSESASNEEVYMGTCQSCPPNYPWVYNPLGQ